MPFFKSPEAMVVKAPLNNALPPAPNPKKPPSKGARKGKNASCWPVTGLVVSLPVGDKAAIP